MPNIQQHIAQWKRNREFLCIKGCAAFPEWRVTIAFYCALHAVQSLLVHRAPAFHFAEHKDRNRYLGDPQNKLLAIWNDYKFLYDGSQDARYNCPDAAKRFPPEVLKDLIQKRLRTVEMQVLTALKHPADEFPHLKIATASGVIVYDPAPRKELP